MVQQIDKYEVGELGMVDGGWYLFALALGRLQYQVIVKTHPIQRFRLAAWRVSWEEETRCRLAEKKEKEGDDGPIA